MRVLGNAFNLVLTLSFYSLLLQYTIASPLSGSSVEARDLVKRYSGTPSGKVGSGGPDTSDYPNNDAIRSDYTNPNGPFVFFSQIGDSTPAFNFAQSKGGVIFRQAFSKKFTVQNGRSTQWYQDFADRFSGVFAEKASGDVYLVSTWNYQLIDACRVWTRIEYPTLQQNTAVTSVILVDYTNWANQKTIFVRDDDSSAPLIKRGSNDIEKRSDGYCFDWDRYGDDPADPDGDGNADIGYYPGYCGVHITQYQKNEGPSAAAPSSSGTSDYRFDITLKDDQGENIGSLAYADGPTGTAINVDSKLPYVFEVTAGSVDDDPVSFAYAGQTWTSNDGQCSFGGYDSGSRNGDCGFSC